MREVYPKAEAPLFRVLAEDAKADAMKARDAYAVLRITHNACVSGMKSQGAQSGDK